MFRHSARLRVLAALLLVAATLLGAAAHAQNLSVLAAASLKNALLIIVCEDLGSEQGAIEVVGLINDLG